MDAPEASKELTDFPLPDVPDVVQFVVAEKCEIADLLRLYVASHWSEEIVKKARIVPKEVRIGFRTLDITLSNNSRINWLFEQSSRSLDNFSFRNLVKTAKKDGCFWKTSCLEYSYAMRQVFMHFKRIFAFEDVEHLEIAKGSDDSTEEYILQNIKRARNLTLQMWDSIPGDQLDFLLSKFIPGGTLNITIVQDNHIPFFYQKNLPVCSSLSLDYFSPRCFYHKQPFATTITHIHLFHFDFDDSEMLNELFREWKAGSFPNLQILERGERAHEEYTDEKLYRNLDVRIWRQRREQEININRFFYYLRVMHVYRYLCLARAKDIRHDHKYLEASIIPTPRLPVDDQFNSFVFVVWGDFMPPVRKPMKEEAESDENAPEAPNAPVEPIH